MSVWIEEPGGLYTAYQFPCDACGAWTHRWWYVWSDGALGPIDRYSFCDEACGEAFCAERVLQDIPWASWPRSKRHTVSPFRLGASHKVPSVTQ